MSKGKWISAEGKTGRLVAARLLPGQDLVEAVLGLAGEYGLRSGRVWAIGSLSSATVVYPNSMEFGDDPMSVAVFHKMEGPVELGFGYGVFGTGEDGEISLHLHGLIMDKDGNMRTGNLVPGSAPVLATVELTLEEYQGLELRAVLDEEWKHKFLHPTAVPQGRDRGGDD